MSVEFTGANTEKIDRLVVAVVELRTTVRLVSAMTTILLPMVVGLLVFLVVQSFHIEARLAQLEARLARLETRVEKVEGRLDQVESRLVRIEATLEGFQRKGPPP